MVCSPYDNACFEASVRCCSLLVPPLDRVGRQGGLNARGRGGRPEADVQIATRRVAPEPEA
eukprot:COSAG01_NODE_49182_length_374_cov_1.123636_1_plen_60_part_10